MSATRRAAASVPGWASILGAVAIVLGVFLTAAQATGWLKQTVLINNMHLVGAMPIADCPAAELDEEGISVAECEYLVEHVHGQMLASPDWFPGAMRTFSMIGTILAFVSVIVGGALVNYTPWAPGAAIAVLVGLVLVDILQFAAAALAGPILRDVYLGGSFLWFLLHLMLLAGVFVGRQPVQNVSDEQGHQ